MKKFSKTMLVILLLVCSVSCSTKSDKKEESNGRIPKKEQVKETISIQINAIGESMAEIAFEPSEISVPASSIIKLTFTNKSAAQGMLHNFVLVELGSGQEIASAGLKAGKKNNFVPKDKRVLFATEVLDLGQKIEVSFEAPKKGSYHFICTYPGHFPKMIGRFNVV